ncbi:hypothetical protein TNCV_2703301 [Trichonephila clavipes]|nr:hypothetical protein TNCV_2703301 [Trichonephila clavipes]
MIIEADGIGNRNDYSIYKETDQYVRNIYKTRRRRIDEADISTPVVIDQRAANYLEEAVRSFTTMRSRSRSSTLTSSSVIHSQFFELFGAHRSTASNLASL